MIEILSWVWAVSAVSVAVWVVAEIARRMDYYRMRAWLQLGVAVLLSACGEANEPGEKFCGGCGPGRGRRSRGRPPSSPVKATARPAWTWQGIAEGRRGHEQDQRLSGEASFRSA